MAGKWVFQSTPPPVPAGAQTPEWLRDLAAICGGKR